MSINILIAEDEWELRNLLKLVLDKYNYDIIEAEDGKQSISLIKKFKPDLVLLDNNMPGYTGYGILQQVRESPEAGEFKTILLVEKSFDTEMVELLKKHVEGFIFKPFEESKVIAEVKRVAGDVTKDKTESTISIAPSFNMKPSDSEKTVVLMPEELRSFSQSNQAGEAPAPVEPEPIRESVTPSEKTVILSAAELKNITDQFKKDNDVIEPVKPAQERFSINDIQDIPQPNPEKSLGGNDETPFRPSLRPMEDTQEVLKAIKPVTEQPVIVQNDQYVENTPSIPEAPPAEPVENEQIEPEIQQPVLEQQINQQTEPEVVNEQVNNLQPEELEPEITSVPQSPDTFVVQEKQSIDITEKEQEDKITNYYSIKGISIRELTLLLSGKTVTKRNISEKPLVVVAYGNIVISEELDTIMEIFGANSNIVVVDSANFQSKIEEIKALNADIFEISPKAFKKLI